MTDAKYLGKGTCRNCKHLIRYKIDGDIFWHYKCKRDPKNEEFDTWKSLTYGRKYIECGFEKTDKPKGRIPKLSNMDDKYKFKDRWGVVNKFKKEDKQSR